MARDIWVMSVRSESILQLPDEEPLYHEFIMYAIDDVDAKITLRHILHGSPPGEITKIEKVSLDSLDDDTLYALLRRYSSSYIHMLGVGDPSVDYDIKQAAENYRKFAIEIFDLTDERQRK